MYFKNKMEFTLQPPKAALFKDLVDGINRVACDIELAFGVNGLSIQCTDTCHATLVETTVPAAWLDLTVSVDHPTTTFGVRLSDIITVLGCRSKTQSMTMICSGSDSDKYAVSFTGGSSGDLDKEFELPMYDFDCPRFELPEREHDVDLELSATRVLKLVQELEVFGEDVVVECNDDAVTFCASSITISMKATLDVSELESYAVPEGGIKNTFATSYLVLVAGFAKLSKYLSVPDKVDVHFNDATPAEFFFKLGTGEDAPTVLGVVAPKVIDDPDNE
jgi:proliferating cell nuclear antigen PCNA